MKRSVEGPWHRARTRHRLGLALTGLLATALLTPPAVVQAAPLPPPETRQEAYAQAAEEYGVPEEILLAVSYLESRWDTHAGEPSRGAGYGPMHLTDVVAANKGVLGHPHAEDRRGDDARPLEATRAREAADIPALSTVELASDLTGIAPEKLRTDPVANIRGGAALLAHYQKQLGGEGATALADWYGAIARYSGATDQGTAADFANEAYAILAEGKQRTTDDGHTVRLPAHKVRPNRTWLRKLDLRPVEEGDTECPRSITCEWIPSPYEEIGDGDYGNHDKADRPANQRIRYIVIHDTEGAYDGVVSLAQDPTYSASWHYTLRNSDGHIAQHVKSKDVAWHAGNWDVNAKSIGLEHEGWAARGTWYSEAMYRRSAKLVRYLAKRFDIPLDRQHILGHDNVQGPTGDYIPGMHWDPGPFWDWAHYFDLLGAPFRAQGPGRFDGPVEPGVVTVRPNFDRNVHPFTGCENNPGPPDEEVPPQCGEWGSSAVFVHTEPRHDAPLVRDIGLHPDTDGESGYDVSDTGGRASTGQQFAVAEVRGDWTAIWYLGQKGWIHNPRASRTLLPAVGWVATPKPGREEIPVYGRAYPEPEAYEGTDIPPQEVTPLPYTLHAGERYVVGLAPEAEYYRAVTFDDFENDHIVVRGEQRYFQVQIGHRVGYVQAEDVDLRLSVVR